MACKNIFLSDSGLLTLGDFDAALIDGFPEKLVHPYGNPPRSDHRVAWEHLNASRCFRE